MVWDMTETERSDRAKREREYLDRRWDELAAQSLWSALERELRQKKA
jgi:hypothetical protein